MSVDYALLYRVNARSSVLSAAEIADSQDLAAIRHDVRCYGYENSLVAWTLSPGWTDVSPFLFCVRSFRAIVYLRGGNLCERCNEASGTIANAF